MDLSADTWRALSALLDEALDRAPAERVQWATHLRAKKPALAALLEQLLAAHDTVANDDLLLRAATLLNLPAPRAARGPEPDPSAADVGPGRPGPPDA